jgi:hypothetical protein
VRRPEVPARDYVAAQIKLLLHSKIGYAALQSTFSNKLSVVTDTMSWVCICPLWLLARANRFTFTSSN